MSGGASDWIQKATKEIYQVYVLHDQVLKTVSSAKYILGCISLDPLFIHHKFLFKEKKMLFYAIPVQMIKYLLVFS